MNAAPGGGVWETVHADADATMLTSEVADGFVGATAGLYAYKAAPRAGNGAPAPAAFEDTEGAIEKIHAYRD